MATKQTNINKRTTTAKKSTKAEVSPAVVEESLKELETNEADTLQIENSEEVQQYITFMVGNEVFGVDMTPVQEIIRVPEVVKVPLSPPSLDGLANLRGKVLPIISLRHIFNMESKENDDATRAVVINLNNQPLGFVVDTVSSVVEAGKDKLETVDSVGQTIDTELLNGLLKDVGGHEMIMVMNFAELIKNEFAKIAAMAKSSNAVEANTYSSSSEVEKANDELQLVCFTVDEQDYAIAIEDVQEIVQAPDNIIKVPHAQSHVLGIMTLRNRLLPLVSLRAMFGMEDLTANEQSRIVVVTLGDISVGIVTDTVNEVLRIAKSEVENMPHLIARDENMKDITQICRLDDGKRLVSIISAANMFDHEVVKEALDTMKSMQDETSQSDDNNVIAQMGVGEADEEQMVIFSLDEEEFGVPIDSVQEIVRVPESLTRVPKTPDYVEGVINLRGTVLPVIDQRLRLGMSVLDKNDRQRIMVFLLNGVRTGFIVDAVTEVLKIHRSDIEESPNLSSEQSLLISRVANLEKQKRMIQLINPDHLLQKSALAELADIAI